MFIRDPKPSTESQRRVQSSIIESYRKLFENLLIKKNMLRLVTVFINYVLVSSYLHIKVSLSMIMYSSFYNFVIFNTLSPRIMRLAI